MFLKTTETTIFNLKMSFIASKIRHLDHKLQIHLFVCSNLVRKVLLYRFNNF